MTIQADAHDALKNLELDKLPPLEALALANAAVHVAQDLVSRQAQRARRSGYKWTEIADVLDIVRQTASSQYRNPIINFPELYVNE